MAVSPPRDNPWDVADRVATSRPSASVSTAPTPKRGASTPALAMTTRVFNRASRYWSSSSGTMSMSQIRRAPADHSVTFRKIPLNRQKSWSSRYEASDHR